MLYLPTWQHFRPRISQSPGCWLWTGGQDHEGYGYLQLGGRRQRAHRLMWSAAYGPIPAGMIVCHHCDVRNCVKPGHLFIGTRADNSHDAQAKGRLGHPMPKRVPLLK